ncbi:translation initiation factor IF-2-like [Frankliniella occidentalis]|uniref:Translation initiation factor IF-2-like n=1 Tax=Frankliniella occidentalis TaxID=133901 RepID=A0A6J1S3H6_FRAOC|nr:translation initiation factor IF-2-like [Frankliniella occidentalis]
MAANTGGVLRAAGAVLPLLLALFSAVGFSAAHEVLLPASFGVLPQYTPLPPPAPLPTVYLRGLDLDLPVALPSPAPSVPDHVTPVLRAGAPAILLLPQTQSSGVYHLSDQHHQFPPFLENVVNRVQNLFSSYVQVDPFNTPFGTPRPPVAAVPATTGAPSASVTAAPGDGSTAAITTTTTTTTTAKTQGRGINVRLLAPGQPPAGSGGPGHAGSVQLPRDVELLDGRLQQVQRQVSSSAGPGQPVAFASATAQVLQPDNNDVDSYHPVNNKDGAAVDERPPPPGRPPVRPPRPYGGRGPSRRPPGPHGPPGPQGPHGTGPGDASYYRKP